MITSLLLTAILEIIVGLPAREWMELTLNPLHTDGKLSQPHCLVNSHHVTEKTYSSQLCSFNFIILAEENFARGSKKKPSVTKLAAENKLRAFLHKELEETGKCLTL